MLADAFLRSGKVRDLYRLSDDRVLLVASDRISAFDVVLPNLVPDKGRVLTGLSRFWFAETAGIVPNHLVGWDPAVAVEALLGDAGDAGASARVADRAELDDLRGRVLVCRAADVLPIEAVVRGYLAGSGWKEYRDAQTVCGIQLPGGLRESDRLPAPIFTPATKAEQGAHDENIVFDAMVDHLASWRPAMTRTQAAALAAHVRDVAIALYRFGAVLAERRGILLADTKFEFGIAADADRDRPEDGLMLVDEAMTPDSSRFWDAAAYEPGRAQASFDKQFVRDWLERQPWDKRAPGPELPADVIAGTRSRYVEAYERITGASFTRYLEEDVVAP